MLKTAAFGYDGKGQRKIAPGDNLAEAWAPFAGQLAMLEGYIDFSNASFLFIVARGIDGAMQTFPVARNDHANHILDVTVIPFGEPAIEAAACELACRVAMKLDLVGLLAVEMFLTRDGTLLMNETSAEPAQFRALVFRCLRDEPVRATTARGVRPAARGDGDLCARRPWRISWAISGRTVNPIGRRPFPIPT